MSAGQAKIFIREPAFSMFLFYLKNVIEHLLEKSFALEAVGELWVSYSMPLIKT